MIGLCAVCAGAWSGLAAHLRASDKAASLSLLRPA
ncbi:hypothetical protein AB7M23_002151 [Pseudomonas sp. HLS-6 TE3448]